MRQESAEDWTRLQGRIAIEAAHPQECKEYRIGQVSLGIGLPGGSDGVQLAVNAL